MPLVLALLLAAASAVRAEEGLAPPEDLRALEETIQQTIAEVAPAVVKILVERAQPEVAAEEPPAESNPLMELFRRFFGGEAPRANPRRAARGDDTVTGMIVEADGWVLTSDWNVRGASGLKVVLPGGAVVPATLKGRDVQRNVALLQVAAGVAPPPVEPPPGATEGRGGRVSPAPPGAAVVSLPFALSLSKGAAAPVQVGQFALAVGKTRGGDQPQVSFGIISAKNRRYGFLQTDCDLNPDNEGGPLLNLRGEVIGMCLLDPQTVELTGVDSGIGFALPASVLARLLPELKQGRVFDREKQRAYLGIQIDTRAQEIGCKVAEVVEGTGAAEAGLKPGDLIIAANGEDVGGPRDLVTILRRFQVGDTVRLTILRGAEEIDLVINLGIHPEDLAPPPARGG